MIVTLCICSVLTGLVGLALGMLGHREASRARKGLSGPEQLERLSHLAHAVAGQLERSVAVEEQAIARLENVAAIETRLVDLLNVEREKSISEQDSRFAYLMNQFDERQRRLDAAVEALERMRWEFLERLTSELEGRFLELSQFASRDASERLSHQLLGAIRQEGEVLSASLIRSLREATPQRQEVDVPRAGNESGDPQAETTPSTSRAGQTRMTSVSISAFSPKRVSQDSNFALDIWAYPTRLRDEILERAHALGRSSEVGTKEGLRLSHGVQVVIKMRIPTLTVERDSDHFFWNGQPANASYIVKVPADAHLGAHAGEAAILCDGLRVGALVFVVWTSPGSLDAS